ncbi:LysR family transcriptional regulator [Endozoicomonas sp. G2_2]|uniref:LysR family transcriptional regulator n=1 Tax=Endozoicomonas sp. G2_2 TaxID=2821092 RepID=UPI001ADD1E1C|nr:LysR family transcriptional regulator [Endozoicomonas sp. G2_2]MBO9471654.1 LysR family transcriptional regulator [Endozoicomonas sp. G2_2]
MTLEDLRIFVAACGAANLSALARELGRTQSSVSQHITRLEKEFRVALIERSTQGIRPTKAGRILRELALDSLNSIELARERIGELAHSEAKKLVVTTGSTTVRHFLKDTVVRFRRRHPDVDIHFVPAGTTNRCFELLKTGKADLALITTQDSAPGMATRTLATQDFYLLVNESDDFAKKTQVQMKELSTIRYLGLSEGTAHRHLIDRAAAEQNVQLKAELVFDDFDTASVFVELGLGHAIVPAVQAYNFVQGGKVRAIPVVDIPSISFGWGFRHGKYVSSLASGFVDLFDQELSKMASIPGLHLIKALE